jgi:hypothetical protein
MGYNTPSEMVQSSTSRRTKNAETIMNEDFDVIKPIAEELLKLWTKSLNTCCSPNSKITLGMLGAFDPIWPIVNEIRPKANEYFHNIMIKEANI